MMKLRLLALLAVTLCVAAAGCSNNAGSDDSKPTQPEPTGKPLPPGNNLGDPSRPAGAAPGTGVGDKTQGK